METVYLPQSAVKLLLLLLLTQGALAYSSDVAGIAAAGCISFVLLVLIIVIIVFSFSWGDWVQNFMASRGKVRMPRAYFKKKEEAKRRLINGSVASHAPSEVNGRPPVKAVDTASWVQGWNQRSNVFHNVYEEKDVTMELGEENDEEFKIETVLVDNEILDVGPFKSDHSKEQPIKGDVYTDPYIYTTIDSTRRSKKGEKDTPAETSPDAGPGAGASTSASGQDGEQVTNFSDVLVPL